MQLSPPPNVHHKLITAVQVQIVTNVKSDIIGKSEGSEKKM